MASAGNEGGDRGSDGKRNDLERIEAAKELLEDARKKRENPYKTPPNKFTTKDRS